MAEVNISPDTLAKIAETVAVSVVKAHQEHDAKARPIEIANPPHPSVFNPRAGEPGYVRPRLSRDVVFCGHAEDDRRMTPDEIDLYNQITVPGRYHQRRWEVVIRESEAPGQRGLLEVRIPCKEVNDRMEMPNGLTNILREIVDEGKAKLAAEKRK